MAKRRSTPFIIASLVAALVLPMGTLAGAAGAPTLSLPASMAAVGDSITQADSTGGTLGADYPQNSWATGSNTTVNSQSQRLLALGAPIGSTTRNLSVAGAKMFDLQGQMTNVVNVQPDYLTVLIGGNDICTDTVVGMTSVSTFHDQFVRAMTTLTSGSPNTRVLVASIPDVYQLWSLFQGSWWPRFIWSAGGICQSLLANPTSTQSVDVQRRTAVRQQNIDFNAQLKAVCESAAFASHCLYDNDAVFNVQFAKSDVAGDYFHPSIAGQAKLATVTWNAGYNWTAGTPTNTPPTASFTSRCTDLTCNFTDTSTDSDGTIASRSWTFGDGAASTATNPSHTYAVGGTYTVGLVVTDNGSATGSTSASIQVTAPAAANMSIGTITGTSITVGRSSWTATATITVVATGSSIPVGGVTVTGTWSGGTSGSGTCTTLATGSCSVTSSNISNKKSSVTFTVTSLAATGWTYRPASNGATSITIAHP
ncbi:MAG: PKD domain-containing protein [Chloroflexota bacterium]